ncbi:Hpt domain-containing protein [Rugamonas sp.]|uniref:Hpt domain-containing protein n=1 Tax=Rugamonas sp. TaxID=1926287 RepID=UPI0025CCA434|nr:Hpt domain-containing protein [Rugamonas sp.]
MHPLRDSVPPLATLATDEGLTRLMGDRALYLQLLKRFRHDYQAAVTRMRQQLTLGDAALAWRLAHTLKGAAGMIGAHAVHAQALELESELARPSVAAEASLARLGEALRELLDRIDELLPPHADETEGQEQQPHQSPPPPATPVLLRRLAQLLFDGDGEAIDVLEQSATVLAASLGVERYQAVAAAAHEFDFEGALEALTPAL